MIEFHLDGRSGLSPYQQLVQQVRLVDQCRMLRLREVDPRPRRVGAAGVERDRHDLEPPGMQFGSQLLRHGQVEAASLPGGPCDQQDLRSV